MQRPSVLERDEQNGEIQRRSTRLHSSSGIPRQPGTDQQHIQEQSLLSEIMRIPPPLVARLKQEVDLDGKGLTAMTFDEKRRLVEAHRQWTKANLSSPSNPAMSSKERHSTSPSSNPAPPDISEPPFTFEFIRSVVDTMVKFDPSPSNYLPPPVKCCPICGALNHTCLGHFSNSLDEFDPNFLRFDEDIDFERDFGQWFTHPDDVGGHSI
ncbi:hypothetical protein F5146DRAFT_665719 [Armillaria mellea]|nr:hypothetical protein F5146DRAFT_665719 [Armillaria mellea]